MLKLKGCHLGIPWQSSGQDSALSLRGPDLIPGWGTKIPQAMQCGFKKKKKERKKKKNGCHLPSYICTFLEPQYPSFPLSSATNNPNINCSFGDNNESLKFIKLFPGFRHRLLFYLLLRASHKIRVTITPILWMRKLRLSELK